jgi:hypothetical protein
MRTTRELREQLDEAARSSGRSLVQEVEVRLGQSFAGDPLLAALGGTGSPKALRLIAMAMQLEAAREEGGSWKDNPEKAEAVRTAASLIIAGIGSLPATPPPLKYTDSSTELRPAERGRVLAKFLLNEIGLNLPTDSTDKQAGEQSS